MVERIIAIAAMPGAGKSIASDVARELGYHVHSMGDIIRDEAKRLGIEPTPANLGVITLELRRKEGSAVVARRLIEHITADSASTAVVEGVRSVEEVEEFRKRFKVTVLAIECSPKVRYSRLEARGRSDDPKSIDDFSERDERELSFGIAKLIESADRRIVNEADVETFRRQAHEALAEMSKLG